jgi:4-amino-4-deoxy-L-arabinose transferase-like glycosyltransferase
MVTNGSLWLDEGDTAMFAVQPDLHAWWHRLLDDRSADCQMPLALLCAWVSGKLFGTHEWQLRAINVLWGALALGGMYRLGRRLQSPWLPLALAIQPYFWFYTNEARPYALELAAGTWLLVALVEFYFARAAGTAWAWLLAGAAFVLFCATLLAPLPVAAVVLAASFIAWRQRWKPERKAVMILLGGIAACVPMGIYYLTALMRGAKGAQIWHVDLKFFVYVVYEFTGMGGIGLTDEDIRGLAKSPHLLHELMTHAPQLLPAALLFGLLAVLLWLGLRNRQENFPPKLLLAGIAIVPLFTASVFVVGSLVLQKAFWARHFAPVFPFYVVLLGLAFTGIWKAKPSWLRILPVIASGLLITSALNFCFAPALAKENYRAATAFVRPMVAANQSVWWLAGGYPATYYGLQCSKSEPEPNKLFLAFCYPNYGGNLQTLPLPNIIVYSKPYIHDQKGTVMEIIRQNHYAVAARFKSFVIWTNLFESQRSSTPDPNRQP